MTEIYFTFERHKTTRTVPLHPFFCPQDTKVCLILSQFFHISPQFNEPINAESISMEKNTKKSEIHDWNFSCPTRIQHLDQILAESGLDEVKSWSHLAFRDVAKTVTTGPWDPEFLFAFNYNPPMLARLFSRAIFFKQLRHQTIRNGEKKMIFFRISGRTSRHFSRGGKETTVSNGDEKLRLRLACY